MSDCSNLMNQETQPAKPTSQSWPTPGMFASILIVFIVVMFPHLLFGDRSFYYRDFGSFGYPLAQFHRDSFWRGEIPLWNPYNSCGLPFLGQWNALVLYPGSLIYLLLPLPWSLNFFCLAHFFLAGLGMYFLARHWCGHSLGAAVAGLAYTFNGLTLCCLMWPNNIAALGWLPWVLLLVEKGVESGGRRIVIAALVASLQMLAGAPEIILLTWTLAGCLWLGKTWIAKKNPIRSFVRFATIVVLVSGLCASTLLPFMDLMNHSHRTQTSGLATWAMPIWGWANLLVPLFRCWRSPAGVYFQSNQHWTSSYYLGVAALAFALLALFFVRRPLVFWLWALSIFGLLMALGEGGHFYSWMQKIFPQIGFMRFPIKFVLLPVLAIPLLAAFGVAALFEDSAPHSRWRIGMWLTGIFSVLILALLLYSWGHPFRGEHPDMVWITGLSRIAILAGLFWILYLQRAIDRPQSRSLLFAVFLLLVWLDGFTHAPSQNPTVKAMVYTRGISARQFSPLPAVGASRAMMGPYIHARLYNIMLKDAENDFLARRLALFGNCNLIDAIPTPDGFYSLYFREQREVWSHLFNMEPKDFPEPLTDFLGIAHLSDPVNVYEWIARTNWMPLVSLGQKPVFTTNAFSQIIKFDFDPRRTVYLPPESRPLVTVTNESEGRILASQFSNQRIAVKISVKQPAMMVLSQAFYHPWKAYVDDRPTPILKANYAFQALEVPAGEHEVRLVYEDNKFRLGTILSLVTLGLCLVAFIPRRKSRSGNPHID